MDREYAAIVVGGGPAGSAAAITLTRLGHRVLLIDDSAESFKLGEALAPAVRPLLRNLGVTERFLADGHLPSYGNVSAWGSEKAHVTDFLSNPHGHGWHLDRLRFDALLRHVARENGATVRSGVKLTDAEREKDGWCVTLRMDQASRPSEVIRADWLIDATGRRSAVARRLGAERIHDDRLIAFFARFPPPGTKDCDRDSLTLVEAAPDGWWYTALVPSGERVVVFLTDSDLADRTVLNSASGFATLLESSQHVSRRITERKPKGDPRGADAGSARLDRFGGDRWLAVGDAAVSFDPLSSQGMLTALYTGMKAGQAIAQAFSGDPSFLEEYVQRLAGLYAAYRRNLKTYYSAEGRWRGRPFWDRRVLEG